MIITDLRTELEKCRVLQRKILIFSERIENINSMLYSSRGQIISDMPRGNGGAATGKTDDLIDKRNRYMTIISEAKNDLVCQQGRLEQAFLDCNLNTDEIRLLRLRFFFDNPWKKCSRILTSETKTDWNTNRCFRTYRKILSKFNKNN